ncbi:MAG: hypothetical protein ACXVI9_09460 [Mucilaginibacter sp.]
MLIQILLFGVLIYFSFRLTRHYAGRLSSLPDARDWIFVILALFFNGFFGIQLYNLPFWVIIDDQEKTLVVKRLFQRPQTIATRDISCYQTTTIKSRRLSYFGIFIVQAGQKKILFSDLNLSDYTVILTFLDREKIENDGEEPFSIFYFFGG